MRKASIMVLVLCAALAHAQTDSMIHVNQFPGTSVADKISAAMIHCPSPSLNVAPCYLILDASLANAPSGTFPALPSNAQIVDFRYSWPPNIAAPFFQHNSSAAGVQQGGFNGCDNGSCGAAVPTGMQQVYVGPAANGTSFWTQAFGSQSLAAYTFPPYSSSQQYALAYPTSVTATPCGTPYGVTYGGVTPTPYGHIDQTNGGAGNCTSALVYQFSAPGGLITTASGATVPIANVTDARPFVLSNIVIRSKQANTNGAISCQITGLGNVTMAPDISGGTTVSWPDQQFTATGSIPVSLTNFNSLTCRVAIGQINGLVNGPNFGSADVGMVGIYFTYSGTPVSSPGYVYFGPGLIWNAFTWTLTLDPNTPQLAGPINTYSVSSLPSNPSVGWGWVVNNAATPVGCGPATGSYTVFCYAASAGVYTGYPLGPALSVSGTISGTTTTAARTFTAAYSSTPQCAVTPSTSLTSWYISAESTTGLTVTYAPSGAANFDVICRGIGAATW